MKSKSLASQRRENKGRASVNKRIKFESLEDRRFMAADVIFDNSTGTLYLEGSDTSRDVAVVRIDTKGTSSQVDDQVVYNLKWTAGISSGEFFGSYNRAAVKSIVFNGYAYNDLFNNLTSIPSEIDGGAGNDILLGGFGNDVIFGGDSNDYIDGRKGNDSLFGGAGNDTIFGDKGNDSLFGGLGTDFLFGGAGADSLFGESGTDWLDGGADIEVTMHGGTGIDTFIDDTNSFPGGDFTSADKWSTQHSDAAMFDYNVANDSLRSSQRLQAYLISKQNQTPNPTPVSLNSAVLAFAQGKLGQKIGDGGCTRLIEAALESVGAKPGENFSSPGFYVWGRLLVAGEAMTPGDIIQFAPGTKFQTPTSSLWMDSFFGHAAIIESVSGTTITMLNQNMAGSPVIRTTVDLATITAGSFAVYRAVPK